MKDYKRVLVLIILIIAFLAIGIIARFNSINELNKVEENVKCNETSYHLITYLYQEDKGNEKTFLTSEKDYDNDTRLKEKYKKNLDFEKHDYLVYFMSSQNGCEREKKLKCIEYEDKGIKLNFEHFIIDKTCDTIYYDAFIVELEKNKYDKNIIVEEIVTEVNDEE